MGSSAEWDRTLDELRRRVGRLESGTGGSRHRTVLPFGVAQLDRLLPGGGLPLGALHEITPGGPALEHGAASILFTAGILARLKGPVLWCLASRDLFAPALARAGLHPDRVIYAETWREADLLPVMEEGVRSPVLAGVAAEVGRLSMVASRRLQLAAEASGAVAVVIRRDRDGGSRAGEGGTACATRWQVSALPSAPPESLGLGRARWQVELTRCRGAPAGAEVGRWVLEACDEAGRLGVPADLEHGSGEAHSAGYAAKGKAARHGRT